MPDGKVCPDQFRGFLWKWTNYIKGYQKRWCVLSNGLLSYYRSPAEMNHTCRGTINLAGAFIDTVDSCSFAINGGTQVWHLRAGSEIERQRWVTALELAKAKAIKNLGSEDESDSDIDDEVSIKSINAKLEDLTTCNSLVSSHGGSLQKSIGDLVDNKQSGEQHLKNINEKAQLFRITSNAMVNACGDFLELAKLYEKKFNTLILAERNKRAQLEETVETLAKQHMRLERACEKEKGKSEKLSITVSSVESPTIKTAMLPLMEPDNENEDDDLFEDAMSDFPEQFPGYSSSTQKVQSSVYRDNLEESISLNDEEGTTQQQGEAQIKRSTSEHVLSPNKEATHHRWLSEDIKAGSFKDQMPTTTSTTATLSPGKQADIPVATGQMKVYRTRIPDRPNANLNLWSIMKNCIGKELSKIPMPVNFSEPLSMTQRLTEELEYSELLDRAAACDNSLEQICYIAAFSISCYASTAIRTGKPFNPLLGETYELDRTQDKGWTSLSEQVSHHPPSLAHHTEGRGWTLWQNFTMSSKFRGKYLLVTPLGTAHCKFAKTGDHYTWKKVTTTVNNIIVGKLWIDQSGDMEIKNHLTGEKCVLKYHAYSYFSRDTPKKVTGFVADKNNVTRYVLSGTWDQKVEIAKMVYKEPHVGPGKLPQGMPASKSSNPQMLPALLVWEKKPPIPGSKLMYHFGEFTCSLNQIEEGVSTTDSRLRPDLRLMEQQKFDEANRIKTQLEELQRARRKAREQESQAATESGRAYESYRPRWFEETEDELADGKIFVYKGGYWEAKEKQDWSTCPKIYLDS